MGITTREYGPHAKGSRLTTAEMDENFNYLENKIPYKVYTALLTQSGGNDYYTVSASPLVVGQTYRIDAYSEGDDFTNVGAPSNAQDVSFVATETTPAIWSNGSVLSTNNGAPMATVLENTIGNIYFEYGKVGIYDIFTTPESLFTSDKTVSFIGTVGIGSDPERLSDGILLQNGQDRFVIVTKYNGDASDNQLNKTSIEIKVYN